jgi:hypothetical protein
MTGLAWQMIVRIFDYYCCKSNALDESVFAMSLGGWRFMVRDFALATHKSKYCKPADCDNVFIGMPPSSHVHAAWRAALTERRLPNGCDESLVPQNASSAPSSSTPSSQRLIGLAVGRDTAFCRRG